MPIKLKTTTSPKTHVAPADAPKAPAKVNKVLGVALAPAASKKGVEGPSHVASATLPTIAESFPIDALSKIDGKGLSGTSFMLDGGALRGLKLQTRRVMDGDEPGFEITFQLTHKKLEGLLDRMKEKEAKAGPVTFRGAALDDEGIAKFTDQITTIEQSGTHAPPDVDHNAGAWSFGLSDAKGGKISVVHEKAALSIRGLVRMELRGDDAQCTEQLKGLVKSLGLQDLLAPPTPKSKQINTLMRALWQADHASATAFGKEDLDKLKVKDLEAALESAGYTPERIAGLHYAEVFPGHFTVIDPVQATEMIEAGARYLYSTVTMPEHVHSILENGQKSSVQRYKDGQIIEGMSTGADFVTGGGAGVFTRLVTQEAIYSGEGWMGRTYKMLQNASQLARTDWHGWEGDYFGRRWDLETKTNFGPDLVKKIDGKGSYQSGNELIFTAGNRPQNIDRVIATSEDDRQTLIDHLKKENYQPHNGLTVEELVVLSPQFLVFGPSPFKDVQDIPAFTTEALADAKAGKNGKLQWLLFEGPGGPDRAALEEKLLFSGPDSSRQVLLKALAHKGTFEMDGAQLDKLLTKLGNGKHEAIVSSLTSEAAEALFRSGSSKAYDLLAKQKDTDSWQPYGLSDEAFVRIYHDLAEKQEPGKPRSKAFTLALDVRAEQLLENGHAGFKGFLAKYPIVTPEDPDKWVTAKLASVKKNGAGKTELTMYLAQLTKPEDIGAVQKKLLQADAASTLEILQSTIAVHKKIHLPAAELVKQLKAMPAKSETRQHVLGTMAAELLKMADPSLLEMLQQRFKGPYDSEMGIWGEDWWKVIEAQLGVTKGKLTDVVKTSMEVGGTSLVDQPKFRELLQTQKALYDVDDPKKFAEAAIKKWSGASAVKLAWMMLGPSAAELKMPAIMAILKSDDYQARSLLSSVQDPAGTFPATHAELRDIVATLTKAKDEKSLAQLLSAAGRNVLLAADEPTLKALSKHVEGKEEVMSLFSMYGESTSALLNELDAAKGKDAKKVKAFVLEHASASLIKQGDEKFLTYAANAKLDYTALGKDAAWAAGVIKEACDDQSYYWTSSYYKNEPDYQKLPVGVKYLLGEAPYDAAVLGEIEKDLAGWAWEKPLFDKFIALAEGLTPAWKKKLVAAQK